MMVSFVFIFDSFLNDLKNPNPMAPPRQSSQLPLHWILTSAAITRGLAFRATIHLLPKVAACRRAHGNPRFECQVMARSRDTATVQFPVPSFVVLALG